MVLVFSFFFWLAQPFLASVVKAWCACITTRVSGSDSPVRTVAVLFIEISHINHKKKGHIERLHIPMHIYIHGQQFKIRHV